MSIMTLMSLDTEEIIDTFPLRNPKRMKLNNIATTEDVCTCIVAIIPLNMRFYKLKPRQRLGSITNGNPL